MLAAGLIAAAALCRAATAPPADPAGLFPTASPARDEPEAFPVALASFSTTLIGSSAARSANLQLAAAALDGVELAPGEELSFNRQVGPRSLERGYQPAPVILHETRQTQLGGGVCQVASTLFDAALMAGLTPVERWRHSSPVDYVALGEDATIAWGAKDLRVRNDLDQRVRVRAAVLGTTLTVRIEGEDEPADRFELETLERESVPGSPGAGREVELYRVKRGAGEGLERELMHRDVYPPSAGARPATEP